VNRMVLRVVQFMDSLLDHFWFWQLPANCHEANNAGINIAMTQLTSCYTIQPNL
jgi:hypothetical protein